MPRIVVGLIAFASGCFFDASYSGTLRCSDDRCPSGLVCWQNTCVTEIPIDMMVDVPPEGLPAALNCADPGAFSTTGGTVMATTTGATSKMSSSCGGFVMNGPDRVYRIIMNGTNQLRVNMDSGARKAYVLAACVESPSTPVCLGNARAIMGSPIVVTPAAGAAFVVVDDETAAASGAYTLRLEVL